MDKIKSGMERRSFLKISALAIAAAASGEWLEGGAFSAITHRYKLASESLLPADIRRAPEEVREAYRFALANRNTLRYIPCYCGCGEQGHTSNASCYFTDNSTPEKPVFDRMSLG